MSYEAKIKWWCLTDEDDGDSPMDGGACSESSMRREIKEYFDEEDFGEEPTKFILMFSNGKTRIERLTVSRSKTSVVADVLI